RGWKAMASGLWDLPRVAALFVNAKYLESGPTVWKSALSLVLYALLLLAIFAIPVRPRTQEPMSGSRVLEILLPGASLGWGVLRSLIAVAAGYGSTQLFFWHFGSPYILTSIPLPNLVRAYGVQQPGPVFDLVNPSHAWMIGLPLVVYAINLVVVLLPA